MASLPELAQRVAQVSDIYAVRRDIRDDDWFALGAALHRKWFNHLDSA